MQSNCWSLCEYSSEYDSNCKRFPVFTETDLSHMMLQDCFLPDVDYLSTLDKCNTVPEITPRNLMLTNCYLSMSVNQCEVLCPVGTESTQMRFMQIICSAFSKLLELWCSTCSVGKVCAVSTASTFLDRRYYRHVAYLSVYVIIKVFSVVLFSHYTWRG